MAEKILIVDDDPETINFLSLFVTRLGFEALKAVDGMQALKLAHEHRPDLIVLDVMIPGLDGYEVARSLRRHPETALIPILMFTAKSQVQDKLTGYEAGVDIYLTKPIHPVELQANIKTLLAQHKARAATLAQKGYVIGVLGAKGGLGVSTVALNLAIAYKQNRSVKVIAVEARPGQGSWGEEMGFSMNAGLANLLCLSRPEITQASVEKHLTNSNFGVRMLLASNEIWNPDAMNALSQHEAVIEELSNFADVVVVDIGTHFHPAYEIYAAISDEIVLVTEPQPMTVRRTRPLLADLLTRDFGNAKPITLVAVNRARTEMTLTMSQIEESIGHSLTLGIPPAPELAYLVATRAVPMYLAQPGSLVAKQFDVLAEHISKHIQN